MAQPFRFLAEVGRAESPVELVARPEEIPSRMVGERFVPDRIQDNSAPGRKRPQEVQVLLSDIERVSEGFPSSIKQPRSVLLQRAGEFLHGQKGGFRIWKVAERIVELERRSQIIIIPASASNVVFVIPGSYSLDRIASRSNLSFRLAFVGEETRTRVATTA